MCHFFVCLAFLTAEPPPPIPHDSFESIKRSEDPHHRDGLVIQCLLKIPHFLGYSDWFRGRHTNQVFQRNDMDADKEIAVCQCQYKLGTALNFVITMQTNEE